MINKVFLEAKANNKTVFVPYFMAGYPSIAKSKKVFLQLAKSGAGLLEVGIPFSDPMADGPTIQQASSAALNAGFKVNQAFELLTELKGKVPPVVIMTYYNLVYANGLRNFASKAAKAGISGIIIPDLPLEEATGWLQASRDHLDTIFLIAPTSTDERIKKISESSSSFIYCVSLTGVTGARKELPKDIAAYLKRVRRITSKPLVVGFGVSTAQHVKQLKPLSDGIIVASAIIKIYSKAKDERQGLQNVDALVKGLKV